MKTKGKKGFTLIELMAVVIIVGVLAAISIPIYRAQVRKAMVTEGAALLGSVLTAQKIYYAEHNTYTTDSNNLNISATGNRYFTSYAITAADANGFTAQTTGTGDAAGITVTLTYTNAAGSTISYSGI